MDRDVFLVVTAVLGSAIVGVSAAVLRIWVATSVQLAILGEKVDYLSKQNRSLLAKLESSESDD